MFDLTPRELSVYRRLRTPERIQAYLDDEVAYNKEPDGTPRCRSPRMVIRDAVGHCMEGAVFGAAALRVNGFEPLLVDLEAVRDDDHELVVFRQRRHWGALAKSNYAGLRFREPVYRTIRELAMSYFEHYYNPAGQRTLRAYSRPVNLRRFDRIGWMTAEEDVWAIPEYLCEVSHTKLLAPDMERALTKLDRRSYGAGMFGAA